MVGNLVVLSDSGSFLRRGGGKRIVPLYFYSFLLFFFFLLFLCLYLGCLVPQSTGAPQYTWIAVQHVLSSWVVLSHASLEGGREAGGGRDGWRAGHGSILNLILYILNIYFDGRSRTTGVSSNVFSGTCLFELVFCCN